ncbi:MAG: helix-turn-helix domain-containing protein [Hamadaea sp.]|uniref:helix-turn-helix domain-containing protein n=1 Tax=Hamadaea sp. TaxID=2024425 RepID=UPI001846734A|nr:helix-turn-helix domain-containing protein [Hamadaea sp.]NUT17938.1 helix-turn-helix domain-containing protein [Hamadaea sp.]
MIAVPDLTVLPPTEPLDELLDMLRRLGSGRSAELVGPDGARLRLPTPVYEVLREVVQAMARGQAVTIAPHNQRLTTQEAADLLGVSRPTLVKMLDEGLIPFEQPGRHRRVRLRDVLAFQENRRSAREAALDELIEASEEADGYRKSAGPTRTR